MKLYYAEVLMPRKVCALAKHVDANVEYVHLDLAKGEHKTPEYLALNPNGVKEEIAYVINTDLPAVREVWYPPAAEKQVRLTFRGRAIQDAAAIVDVGR